MNVVVACCAGPSLRSLLRRAGGGEREIDVKLQLEMVVQLL
jgi:hypothetical protein